MLKVLSAKLILSGIDQQIDSKPKGLSVFLAESLIEFVLSTSDSLSEMDVLLLLDANSLGFNAKLED